MFAVVWRPPFARSRSALAVTFSVALHAAVLVAVSSARWSEPRLAREAPIVVWLGNLAPRVLEPEAAPEPIPETEIEPEPAIAESPPMPREEPLAAESPAVPAEPRPQVPEPEAERVDTAPEIDWEAERAQAVARALEALMAEDAYATFSGDELFEEPQVAAPSPREGLFDTPNRRGGNRSALRTGQARSRFLNRVAEVCNALTGGGIGFSFAGIPLGTACTDPGPTADFFADLRPAYMESLPVCTESEAAAGQPTMFDVDGNEIPTIKCRLVRQDRVDDSQGAVGRGAVVR